MNHKWSKFLFWYHFWVILFLLQARYWRCRGRYVRGTKDAVKKWILGSFLRSWLTHGLNQMFFLAVIRFFSPLYFYESGIFFTRKLGQIRYLLLLFRPNAGARYVVLKSYLAANLLCFSVKNIHFWFPSWFRKNTLWAPIHYKTLALATIDKTRNLAKRV